MATAVKVMGDDHGSIRLPGVVVGDRFQITGELGARLVTYLMPGTADRVCCGYKAAKKMGMDLRGLVFGALPIGEVEVTILPR